MTLRVSVVQYLNTAPLVWGLLHGPGRDRFEFFFTTPACCADHLGAGHADVGIIPSIEYQRIAGLKVLPGISIASKRQVRSVLLLANVPIDQVGTVALDTSSRTSAALVHVLFRKFYARDVTTKPASPDPSAMLRAADAALLIGDPALVYFHQAHTARRNYSTGKGRKAGDVLVYDLAAEWKRFTGLPFVFAIWACRSDPACNLTGLGRDFERSRDEGLAHIEEIAAEWAPRLGLSAEDLRIYLTGNIDYTLDSENLAGLRLFYRLAHEVGAIPEVRDLEFI